MATATPDTGVGATAALTDQTFASSIVNVSEVRAVVESLDKTHLGLASTAYAQKMPGDNPELQDVTLTYLFDSTEAALIPRADASDTLTITLPLTSGSTAMSVVVTGFIKENTISPVLARNQVNQGTMTFTPDGITVTLTDES